MSHLWIVGFVFCLVYSGLFLGRFPGFKMDRTGIALLGALILVAVGIFSLDAAWNSIDVPTIALLFSIMIISAQLRLGGFYGQAARVFSSDRKHPLRLLFWVVLIAGVLSAFLTNDVICFAVTPVLIEICLFSGLNPIPYLLALAAASNVGSAATILGNPHNILIGEHLQIPFLEFIKACSPPAFLGLLVVWGVLAFTYRHKWKMPSQPQELPDPPFAFFECVKGLLALAIVLIGFLLPGATREAYALGAAALLLASRTYKSRDLLDLVDWQLLILFMGLFVVNNAFQASGLMTHFLESVAHAGINLEKPLTLFIVTPILSNLVSNVPTVMFLLPLTKSSGSAWAILALSSTLAGNFIIIGSIANIIVLGIAQRVGIPITYREHARTGIPITLLTLGIAAFWLWIR